MRISIADDDCEVRGLMRMALRGAREVAGCTIDEAVDGADLLRLLCDRAYDLVVTDVVMPGLSGIEVVAVARRLGITTPFVVVTGLPENVLGDDVEKLGRTRLVRKPFTIAALYACVAELLAGAPSR